MVSRRTKVAPTFPTPTTSTLYEVRLGRPGKRGRNGQNGAGILYTGEDLWLALDILKKSQDVSTKLYRLDEGEEAGTLVPVLLAFKKVMMPRPEKVAPF